jgi:hypothetical protein
LFGLATVGLAGCGTVQQNSATEQLLASDAVDAAIARIDFSPLEGERVFFETRYIQNLKTIGFVSAEYMISSLRQQMTAAGLLLQDSPSQADYIVEARVGTLGSDAHDMIYGLPASNVLSAASSAVAVVSQAPSAPSLPEIALARRKNQLAAAKVACYAYHRESREPVWQSGLSTAKSTARDTWVLGVGPFQKGAIYTGQGLANSSLDAGGARRRSPVSYREAIVFDHLRRKRAQERAPGQAKLDDKDVQQASGEAPPPAIPSASGGAPSP